MVTAFLGGRVVHQHHGLEPRPGAPRRELAGPFSHFGPRMAGGGWEVPPGAIPSLVAAGPQHSSEAKHPLFLGGGLTLSTGFTEGRTLAGKASSPLFFTNTSFRAAVLSLPDAATL